MLDLNRGCVIRYHAAGFKVAMYKDEPGVYRDAHGHVIGEEVAKEAGFPVEEHAKEAARKQRVAEELAKIDAQFRDAAEGKVVADFNGFKVVAQGNGAFGILDPDDNSLTRQPLSKREAERIAKNLGKSEQQEGEADGEAQA